MNYNDFNMDIPEGLYLAFSPKGDGNPCITDAQEIIWAEFYPGGNGDPVAWRNSIIVQSCKALGVELAYSPDGQVFGDVAWFVTEFLSDDEFND